MEICDGIDNDCDGLIDSDQTGIVCPSDLSVARVMLYNGDNDQALFELTEGMVINIDELPTLNLNIQVYVTDEVGSVQILLSGAKTASKIKNNAPLSLFGDTGGSVFTTGSYNLNVTPYSEKNLSGTSGMQLSIDFEIFDENEPNSFNISLNQVTTSVRISF